MPPMPVPMMQPTRSGSYGQLVAVPARLGERLVGGDERELREAVGAARLLAREVLGRLEVGAGASPSSIPQSPGGPALVQRAGADAERRDGADAGDDDARFISSRGSTIRSIGVADGLDLRDVVALELDAELVLDDLRELGEVERVDVELLERRVARDLVGVGAELRERVEDDASRLLRG